MQDQPLIRTGRILIAVLSMGLLMSACASPVQVRWSTYSPDVRIVIDSAAASRDCDTLSRMLAYASATSDVHQRATGISNAALEEYIRTAQQGAGCT